jgi:hypothetical protein
MHVSSITSNTEQAVRIAGAPAAQYVMVLEMQPCAANDRR